MKTNTNTNFKNNRADALKLSKIERLKQEKLDAKKQPQVLLTGEALILANIAARKARELNTTLVAKTNTNTNTNTNTRKNITTTVNYSTATKSNYKITDKNVLDILNKTIKEGRNLLGHDCIKLGIEIGVNHNSVKIISEFASTLVHPETYIGTFDDSSNERYIRIMKKALNC